MPKPLRATTQQHLEVEDIVDNIVILKDGSAALILQTNAINFGLLSEEEQDATIYAYAGLLNSLSFSIQILIRSQPKDITSYLKLLKNQEIKQKTVLKKQHVSRYRKFVEQIVKQRNVLDKKFYIILPFSSLELGVTQKTITSQFKKQKELPFDKAFILEKAKNNLFPKRNHIIGQLARLGLSAKQLNTQEIIQLLYTVYNPDSSEGISLADSKQYQTALVEAAISKSSITAPTQTGATNQGDISMNDQSSPKAPDSPTPTPSTPTTTPPPTTPTPPTTTPTPTPPPASPAQSQIDQAVGQISKTPPPPSTPTPPAKK